MDRERAAPEDLGPLELRKLRDLDLEEPSAPGRPAHVSAASGVARRGDFVYVIGDDELHLGVFRLSSDRARRAPARARRRPAATIKASARSAKPDLEALTLLPPFESHPYGALLGLGSGSARERSRGFVCALGADGSIAAEPQRARPRAALPAVARTGRRAEHRGRRDDGRSPLAAPSRHAARGRQPRGRAVARAADALAARGPMSRREGAGERPPLRPRRARRREAHVQRRHADRRPAARLHGIRRGRRRPDPRLGRGHAWARWERHRLRTIDRRWKVEGVHATIDTGVLDFTFVCDQDDPGNRRRCCRPRCRWTAASSTASADPQHGDVTARRRGGRESVPRGSFVKSRRSSRPIRL